MQLFECLRVGFDLAWQTACVKMMFLTHNEGAGARSDLLMSGSGFAGICPLSLLWSLHNW